MNDRCVAHTVNSEAESFLAVPERCILACKAGMDKRLSASQGADITGSNRCKSDSRPLALED